MLKLLSLFSGIGAFEKALTNIDELFEVVNYCEIDKYASKAYSLIHNIPESETRRGRVGHGVSQTLLTSDQNGVVVEETDKVKKLFNIYGENHGGSFGGNVYDQNGISPALLTMQGGNKQPLIIETVEVSNALTTVQKDALLVQSTRRNDNIINELKNNTGLLRIRRFTPKEYFRLMGFEDADVDILLENGISNTQLYKMAGNSIVVDVLEELFVELLNQYEDVFPIGD